MSRLRMHLSTYRAMRSGDIDGKAHFTNAVRGEYLVEVDLREKDSEYRIMDHPSNPGLGPGNERSVYGNPRWLRNTVFGVVSYSDSGLAVYANLTFEYFPIAYLTGTVLNSMTEESVAGAKLTLSRNCNGRKPILYERLPWPAYGMEWITDLQGNFPTNILVPSEAKYRFEVTRNGYEGYTHPLEIVSPAQGQTKNMGTFLLVPDEDAGPPEFWGGWITNFPASVDDPTSDEDEDGYTIKEEWIAGTDPTKAESHFTTKEAVLSPDGFRLSWNAEPGRSYRILRREDLTDSGTWPIVYEYKHGPQRELVEWTDTNSSVNVRAYRLEVAEP